MDNITDPTDFSHSDLRAMDVSLRCAMCKEFFQGPMILPCGHSFCSLCIRGYLPSKSECPTCRHHTSESELLRNTTMEDIVFAYTAARLVILSAMTESERPSKKRKRCGTVSSSCERESSVSDAGPSNHKRSAPGHTSKHASGAKNRAIAISSDEDDNDDAPSRSTSKRIPKNANINPIVPCPLCDQRLLASLIDGHIDRGCPVDDEPSSDSRDTLKDKVKGKQDVQAWSNIFSGKTSGGAKGRTKVTPIDPPDPLPKVTYHLMKEKAIRELLAAHSLPTTGDKPILCARYSHWITLFNSNLDTSRPRTIGALRKELKEWERVREKEKEVIAGGKRKETVDHVEKYSDDFTKLIKQARAVRTIAPSTISIDTVPVTAE